MRKRGTKRRVDDAKTGNDKKERGREGGREVEEYIMKGNEY